MPTARSQRMPVLQEVPLRLPADSLLNAPRYFALTADGHLMLFRGHDVSPTVVALDSTGAVMGYWGRRGPGPGEWSDLIYMLSGDSTFVAYNLAARRLEEYSPTGRYLGGRSVGADGLPGEMVGDSIDFWTTQVFRALTAPNRTAYGPFQRFCARTSCSRTLLRASDSVVHAVAANAPLYFEGAYPGFAAEPGRFVLGDGTTYRLTMFDANGNSRYQFGRSVLPRMVTRSEMAFAESLALTLSRGVIGPDGKLHPASETEKLEALRTRPRPHFQYGSLYFDDHHRLWVIGKANDSTFIDVFADSTFLGRLMMDCRRSIPSTALRGHWLALGCVTPDSAAPYALRLYRIVEPTQSARGGSPPSQ